MTMKVEDRRVRRTKQLIKQSLIELMHEKPFNEIKIKDITERADLNRGTFYLHYVDIYDLLSSIENEIFETLEKLLLVYHSNSLQISCFDLLKEVFSYIETNRDLFEALLNSQVEEAFLTKLQSLIKTLGLELMQTTYKDTSLPHYTYFLSFVLNGVLGVTEQWFKNGMDLSSKEMATMINHFIMDGVSILSK
ncbi:MAG: TetR/AcrR family transcriptional regulator C-terminal domain-containing protein, partial [Turicibacter sp.]|nr:TetR/AcrR family transcriptional regulator C-terminal domain-containing protein [Turicibacter sp.]